MTNKKKKLAKNRLDKYYHLAKEQGFRSRAAFKLIQLNKKYDFLSSARAVIDLCSAPGGWLQVASKYMPISSILIGIDIVPIKPIRNTITIQADITTAKCKTEIRNHLKGIKADVILHDGAPNVGTAWIQDAFSQSELVLHSLKLATEFLKPGGWFITKVFRSNDYNSLLWVFNQLFKKVEATKPQASRNTSAEIFVVCHGYIAPKKIDAKLLDPKYVFKEIDDIPNQKINIFSKNPPKRSRSGYEDGNVTLFKKISVSDFIESTTPIEMLGEYNQFEFDEKSLIYKNHKKTNQEILSLCSDLRVLGKSDFKALLKWRIEMREYKKEISEKNDINKEENPVLTEEQEKEDEEQNLTKELDLKIEELNKKNKKRKKKEKEKKKKLQQKIELNMILPDDKWDMENDYELFSLNNIKKYSDLEKIIDVPIPEINLEENEKKEKELDNKLKEDDLLNDEEKYNEEIENILDQMYEQYLEKSSGKSKKKKLLQLKSSEEPPYKKQLISNDYNYIPNLSEDISYEEKEENNPLIIKDTEISTTKQTKMWFSQNIFNEIEDNEDEEDEEKICQLKKNLQENDIKINKIEKNEHSDKKEEKKKKNKIKKIKDENNFEEVPIQQIDELDDEERKKLLALGTMMKNDKELREEIIDRAYNRYAFNDVDIPSWFFDEENEHNKPQLPVTKEMIQEIKKKLIEINARPIKKVMEAKARKKQKLNKKLKKLKNQVQTIMDSTDLNSINKSKALEKLYKKTKIKKKTEKNYVVSKKMWNGHIPRGVKKNGIKTKLVDPRMKKDLRSSKLKEKKKGKKRTRN